MSGLFHFIFLHCGWQQVTETATTDKGGMLFDAVSVTFSEQRLSFFSHIVNPG